MQLDETNLQATSRALEELFFKFILVGNAGVGKTSLVGRYIDNKFQDSYNATIGAEFGSKTVDVNEQLKIRLQIWDTAGQESFNSITKSFYRNAHCIFLVYDINNRESFEQLESWMECVIENADPEAILVLIGNKFDAASGKRAVQYQEGVCFMKEHNLHFFFETSAFKGKNVELAFLEAIKLVYLSYTQDRLEGRESYLRRTRDTVSLRPSRGSRVVKKGEEKEKMLDFSDSENQHRSCNC